MIIAQEKRKTNIAEYILYMWQIEDTLRALKFDEKSIEALSQNYDGDDELKANVCSWYLNLSAMIQKENKQTGGHIQVLTNLVNDMNEVHLALLNSRENIKYVEHYESIKMDIDLVRKKSGRNDNDIEVLLNSLYIILMLRMKQQNVTEGTTEAVQKFGSFLGRLSQLYKKVEEEETL